jgi:hypothetical protein
MSEIIINDGVATLAPDQPANTFQINPASAPYLNLSDCPSERLSSRLDGRGINSET